MPEIEVINDIKFGLQKYGIARALMSHLVKCTPKTAPVSVDILYTL